MFGQSSVTKETKTSLNALPDTYIPKIFYNLELYQSCAKEHTNFQLCHYATYPRIYEAVANISKHQSHKEVTLQYCGSGFE